MDGEEVEVPGAILVYDLKLSKKRRLKFQKIGDAGVLHYSDEDTEETVYVKYIKTEDGLKINAYVYKEGKINKITSQQPVQNID